MDRRVAGGDEPLIRRDPPARRETSVRRPAIGPARGDAAAMRIAGWLAVGAVATLAAGAFALLILEAARTGSLDPGSLAYVARITGFTLWQAGLSTVLSLLFALPLARAVARRPAFPGRGLLVSLLALPLVIPSIVAALAVIAVWGRQGPINDLVAWAGGERVSIYGLSGILIAHVFFNMPLAARLMLRHLAAVPTEQWRLGAQLSLSPLATFRLIEWPALRPHVAGVAMLVFALCVTSFAVVLILGGGPGATTLEVAIYQALRFEFEPGRAVALALVQLALTGGLALFLARGNAMLEDDGAIAAPRRIAPRGRASRALDAGVIAAGMLFVLGPLAMLVASGLAADLPGLVGQRSVRGAIATSLGLGTLAALLALALTLALVLGGHAGGRGLSRAGGAVAALVLVVPPTVLGAGWFLGLRGTGSVFAAAPVMIVVVNAAMALPFTMRVVGPAWRRHARRVDRLALSLGMGGRSRLWRLDGPAMGGALALAFAFALALSLGDLGVIALFGSQDWVTLPLLLMQRMGAYRTADAAGLALILAVMCLGIVALAQLAERRART